MVNKVVIFDLDGTLALIDKRRKVSTKPNGKIHWGKFFDPANIDLDEPNVPVIESAKAHALMGCKIIIFSGRSADTKEATVNWLNRYNVPYSEIHMRPSNDYRRDDILKAEMFENVIGMDNKDQVMCIYDDRDQVVNKWRSMGITCFQVAEGSF